jgi:SAM-dependent methyltransferase
MPAAALARCIVCDGVSERVVWREHGYEGRACACGTVYTAPPPAAGSVDPTVELHSDSYYAEPARRRLAWLRRHRPGGTLLEVGCGEGHFLAAAQAAGYDVAGIEPDPGRARRAEARLRAPVDCALLEDSRPGAARFDIVYHCDLLSHFEDPIAALRRMVEFLEPDGVIAFEVGLLGGVAPWWYGLVGSLDYPQHRWLYSERSLRRLLARADLELVHRTRFGLGLATLFRGGVRSLARRARRLRPVPRHGRREASAIAAGERERRRGSHGAVLALHRGPARAVARAGDIVRARAAETPAVLVRGHQLRRGDRARRRRADPHPARVRRA